MCKPLGLSLGYVEDQHTQQSSFTKNEKNITCTLHNTESELKKCTKHFLKNTNVNEKEQWNHSSLFLNSIALFF